MTNIINRDYLQNPRQYSPTPKQLCVSGTISILSLLIFKNKISKFFEVLNHKSPKFSKLAYRAWHIINASLTFIITTIVQKIFGWGSSDTTARAEERAEERAEGQNNLGRDNFQQENPQPILSDLAVFVDPNDDVQSGSSHPELWLPERVPEDGSSRPLQPQFHAPTPYQQSALPNVQQGPQRPNFTNQINMTNLYSLPSSSNASSSHVGLQDYELPNLGNTCFMNAVDPADRDDQKTLIYTYLERIAGNSQTAEAFSGLLFRLDSTPQSQDDITAAIGLVYSLGENDGGDFLKSIMGNPSQVALFSRLLNALELLSTPIRSSVTTERTERESNLRNQREDNFQQEETPPEVSTPAASSSVTNTAIDNHLTHASVNPEVVGHPDWYSASPQERINRLIQKHPTITGSTGGIQGRNNSCFMDSIIFNMFALNTSFDFLLEPNGSLSEQGEDVRKTLVEVVSLLRPNKNLVPYVPSDVMSQFREAIGAIPGQQALNLGINRDPDEFIKSLFKTLNCPELIKKDVVATDPDTLQQGEYFSRERDSLQHFIDMFIYDGREILTSQDILSAFMDTISEHRNRKTNLSDPKSMDDVKRSKEIISHPEEIENLIIFSSTDNSYEYVLPKKKIEINGHWFELHTICPRAVSHYPSFIYSDGEWYMHDSMADQKNDGSTLTSIKRMDGAAAFIDQLMGEPLDQQKKIIDQIETQRKGYRDQSFKIEEKLGRMTYSSPNYQSLMEQRHQIDQEKQKLENYIRIIRDSCIFFYGCVRSTV